ncbi:putative FAD-binding domain, FAD/NAD(P)-binding domain-containing protein [Lupinus albus]|uniref:Putative FAD-binding domain, FAD/NAD(P)-binding domain-containing protein n=1 Tax=Lupinus albus TaxID=3870 RepID=A0A6A4P020_LUPAL|nr:putative FAD-binding domain, FAD/NAD(P)-binding domain-containing protein [Lupinus albus]
METSVDVDIVIVGGGICGLATALALHRKRIKSLVLERSEELRETGAAIIVQANGWGRLIVVGEGEAKEMPFGVNGEVRCLKRSDLMKAMANSLPEGSIRTSCEVVSVELDPLTHYPRLMLTNGTILQARVVIGCDGVNSCVANMVGSNPTNLMLFSTCVARGFTNYPNGHHFATEFVVITRGQVQLGTLPVTHNLVYWFITRLRTSQDSTISKDAHLIRESLTESMMGFPVQWMEMIRNSELKSLHLTELKYRPPWELIFNKFRKGTITLAGDSMHATGPFIAQGGSASIEDAVVLARWLAHKKVGSRESNNNNNNNITVKEALIDQYVKERRKRIMWLSFNSFLIGKKLDTQSIIVRYIIIAILVVLFRDPNWHTQYDCGTLQ